MRILKLFQSRLSVLLDSRTWLDGPLRFTGPRFDVTPVTPPPHRHATGRVHFSSIIRIRNNRGPGKRVSDRTDVIGLRFFHLKPTLVLNVRFTRRRTTRSHDIINSPRYRLNDEKGFFFFFIRRRDVSRLRYGRASGRAGTLFLAFKWPTSIVGELARCSKRNFSRQVNKHRALVVSVR